jgi:hypothetical protein
MSRPRHMDSRGIDPQLSGISGTSHWLHGGANSRRRRQILFVHDELGAVPRPSSATIIPAHTFMLIVGAIEILAGALVAIKPRIGGYVVAAWLVGIIGQPAAVGELLRHRPTRPWTRDRCLRVGRSQPGACDLSCRGDASSAATKLFAGDDFGPTEETAIRAAIEDAETSAALNSFVTVSSSASRRCSREMIRSAARLSMRRATPDCML